MKSCLFVETDARILQIGSYFLVGMFVAMLYIYSEDVKQAFSDLLN